MANNIPSIITDITTLKESIATYGLQSDTLKEAILVLDRLHQTKYDEETLIRSGNSEVSSLNSTSISGRSSFANSNNSEDSSVVSNQTRSNISEASQPSYRATILEVPKAGVRNETRMAIGAQNTTRRLAETAAVSQKGGKRSRKTCRCRQKYRQSHKRQNRSV